MAMQTAEGGPIYNATSSGTISVTPAGVQGPNVSCGMVVYSIPSTVTATVNLCSDSTYVGGVEMQASMSYGPYPNSNLNLDYLKSGSGTITINYRVWK